MTLSESEQAALEFLRENGGSVLTSRVPDKNERDAVFRTPIAGMTTYRKLEKKGLVLITEEEPITDVPEDDPLFGFQFTPMIELVKQA